MADKKSRDGKREKTRKEFTDAQIEVAVRTNQQIFDAVFAQPTFKKNLRVLKEMKAQAKGFARMQRIIRRQKKSNLDGHGLPDYLGKTVEILVAAYSEDKKPNHNHDQRAAELIQYLLDHKMTTRNERALAFEATRDYKFMESNARLHDEWKKKAKRPKKEIKGPRAARVSAL